MPAVTAARVTVIPAKKDRLPINVLSNEARKLRVAAYARVSTNNEEQLTSYEAQVDYYTRYIQSKDEWQFVEVYTDEGISATNTKKRDGFNRMVADALAGKINSIGQSRCHVGFMDDDGNMAFFCRQYNRNGDKTALGEYDIRLIVPDDFYGFPIPFYDPEGIRKIFQTQIPSELSGGDSVIGNPLFFNQSTLHAVVGPYVTDFISRFFQPRQERNIRSDMSGCASAG